MSDDASVGDLDLEEMNMEEKKGWKNMLKAAAGMAIDTVKKFPDVTENIKSALEIAEKVINWAEKHDIDLKDVFENASKGIVLLPESVINEYLGKSIQESAVDAVVVSCRDGHMEVMVTKKKTVGTFVALAGIRFTESALDKKKHVLVLELLEEIQVKGMSLISKVLMATTAFILRAIYGKNIVEPEALESEIVSVEGRTIRVDLDRIKKLEPVLSGKVMGISIFDLLAIKQIHEIPGALEVTVELEALGRLAARGLSFGKDTLKKRHKGEKRGGQELTGTDTQDA